MNTLPVNEETRKSLAEHLDRIELAKMTTRTEVYHKNGVLESVSMFVSNIVVKK